MSKTRSVIRNQNASSRKRLKTCDNGGVAPWPHHHVLYLVMMKLGVIDFVAFSGVCKSWRSFALSNRHTFTTRNQNNDASTVKKINSRDKSGLVPWSDPKYDVALLVMMRLDIFDFYSFSRVCKSWKSLALSNKNKFMASRPPMSIWVSSNSNEKQCYSSLEGIKQKMFVTRIRHSSGKICVGLTCGYLVLFGEETNDFWVVNLITEHQLYFPSVPCLPNIGEIKVILVFSPSIPGWVLVVTNSCNDKIWFSTSGKRAWSYILSDSPIYDLRAFKGKIYTIHKGLRLCELRLDSKPKLTRRKTKNFPKSYFLYPEFASSGENLYLVNRESYIIFELDFGEMKWVMIDLKTIEEYDFFFSLLKHGVAIKPESRSLYKRYDWFIEGQGMFFVSVGCYFPHLCLDVDILDE